MFIASSSEINPKNERQEHCNAITLKSGKELKTSIHVDKQDMVEKHALKPIQESLEESTSKEVENQPQPPKESHVRVSFPQCLEKIKFEEEFAKFLEVFKKLHVNIPFIEALE